MNSGARRLIMIPKHVEFVEINKPKRGGLCLSLCQEQQEEIPRANNIDGGAKKEHHPVDPRRRRRRSPSVGASRAEGGPSEGSGIR